MVDNIPMNENVENLDDTLPANYKLLLQNKAFRELTEGTEKEEERKKCR